MPDVAAAARVFKRNRFCVIATASRDGAPWLSPVFYNYGPDYTVVWESARDARHSLLLAENPRVALFVKDEGAKGPANDLYVEATARPVPAEGLAQALDVWQEGPHGHSDRSPRSVEDYAADKPLGLYEASIDKLYVLKQTRMGGYEVDVREEVDLTALRGLARPNS